MNSSSITTETPTTTTQQPVLVEKTPKVRLKCLYCGEELETANYTVITAFAFIHQGQHEAQTEPDMQS